MRERWPNFSKDELACQHCGKTNPNPEFQDLMWRIQEMRDNYGPMVVNSAYRCPQHPLEASKNAPGQHAIAAIDVACSGAEAILLLEMAICRGFTGIGIQQKGDGRFIHLDLRDEPTIWSY